MPLQIPTIHTQRLALRQFTEADAPDVFRCCSNPILGHDAGWPQHTTIEDSLVYIRDIVPLGYIWAMTALPEQASAAHTTGVIGSIGLLPDPTCPEESDRMLLGYWLAEECWGKGFMTEAARSVIAWGFSQLQLKAISTSHYLFNTRSQRIIEKCGFVYTETAPWLPDDPDEEPQDARWYILERAQLPTMS